VVTASRRLCFHGAQQVGSAARRVLVAAGIIFHPNCLQTACHTPLADKLAPGGVCGVPGWAAVALRWRSRPDGGLPCCAAMRPSCPRPALPGRVTISHELRCALRCQHRPRHIRTLRVGTRQSHTRADRQQTQHAVGNCSKIERFDRLSSAFLCDVVMQPSRCPREEASLQPVGVVAPGVEGDPASGLFSGRTPVPPSGTASAGVRLSRRACSCAVAAVGLTAALAAPSAVSTSSISKPNQSSDPWLATQFATACLRTPRLTPLTPLTE